MSTTDSIPTVKDQIREFILENLAQPKGISSFTDGEPLMESGIIDSLGIFRLVSFLEDQLGVRIDDQEINIETLKSLNTIEELVIRKRASK
jgi:acyl carrier protein